MRYRDVRRASALVLALVLAALATGAARAQASALYFPLTGHHLTDEHGFLSFWQAHDGARLLGFPVTEVLVVDGVGALQYFEKGRLEQFSAADGSLQPRTGRVAAEYAETLYRSFPARPPRPPVAGELYVEVTGHGVREPFLSFWQAAGGIEFFGAPISEPLWEQTPRGQRQVQYFDRARLERDASLAGTPDEIQVGDLGRALAELRGLSTAPVANWGAQEFGPRAPAAADVAPLGSVPSPAGAAAAAPTARPAAAPAPQAAAPAPVVARPAPPPAQASGVRRIVVNLSDQWLYAYEGDDLVFDAPVATGRDGMNTPTGNFRIYAKLPVQTMDGVTDGEYWRVPNVPHVMYIHGGVALHGTYWHNLFGSGARPSHGCVNLPLKSAAWLYSWASVGTPVRVTY